MSENLVAVCGFTGGIVSIDTQNRFRPFAFGTVSHPPSKNNQRMMVSATKIAQRLSADGHSTSIYGLIGDDGIGKNIARELTKCGADTKHLQKIAKSPSEQLLMINDRKGYAFAYRFNPFDEQMLESTLQRINKLPPNVSVGVITSLNSNIMLHCFKLLEKKQTPIIWNSYMCYNTGTPIGLLENVRKSQVVILSDHEASYFKQNLGFTSIDQLVSEGPSDILILSYTNDGRIAVDHYDKDRHTVSYKTANSNLPPSILIESMDEFSIGMAERVHSKIPLTEAINNCVEHIDSLAPRTPDSH